MGPAKYIQKVISTTAPPITAAEFTNALLKIWIPRGRGRDTLGLAISGGVDSMALGALCSRLQDPSHWSLRLVTEGQRPEVRSLSALKFRAFIVDHDLRAGSDLEAEAVSKILEGRDIETQILKIKWPGQESPASLANFESLARKYRFRLLGRACKEMGINSLLLAHHEDDQAETILMRLSNGQSANGLLGMKTPAGIPECYGIHGVYESGGSDSMARGDADRSKGSFSSAFSSSRSDSPTRRQLPIETGGIQVYRPFLHFSKARLIATCMAENMKWFEDHTNTEPTTTMRNAVRHMYSNRSMPVALSKPALLALSMRLNDNAARRFDNMKSWLAKCKVTCFETCVGTVKVRFADLTQLRQSDNVWPPLDASRIAAELLREVILLVSPREHIERSSLHSTVCNIFPEISQRGEHSSHTTAFTASGVYFQPILTTLPQDQPPSFQNKKSEWFLSRQPYNSESLPKIQLDVPAIEGSWSPWYFYDGRYWIRVQNLSRASLLIQPFHGKHLAEFRASLTRADELRLDSDLKEKAPGKVRWTLPAIVRKEEDEKERLIALPSLDLSISECMVRWEIRYKKVPAHFIPNGASR